jgi:hypothetical protein
MTDKEKGGTDRRTFIKATGALGVGTGVALTAGTAVAAAETTGPDAGTRSFNNLGQPVILGPGGVFNWWYDRGGSDFGYQHAGPNIVPPLNGARHTFFNPGKAVFSNGYTQYYISIRNDGTANASHNLQGGGAT